MVDHASRHRPHAEADPAPGQRRATGPSGDALDMLSASLNGTATVQRLATMAPNRTGLPDTLKAGVEALSGMSLDHVRVHRNSDKPAQLAAHAYAQGADIHLAPGQERHLPHEAWHVVQQARGRVRPTMQLKAGVPVNDDAGLEGEADVMGARAMAVGQRHAADVTTQRRTASLAEGRSRMKPQPVMQGVFIDAALDGNAKAKQAFQIFTAAIPDRSASKFVQQADFVIIEFEVSPHLPEARGDTSKQVELFGDAIGKFENAPGKLGGAEQIKNKKTYITIRLNGDFVANNSPPIIAKTLAHELGTHVAPFVDIFTRAHGDEGLTDKDIAFMSHRGHGKGAGDHAAIRDRTELDYENIVRTMAENLGGPKNADAQDVVYHYVLDIARYDELGMPMKDAGAIENRAQLILKDGGMAWALPYMQGRHAAKKSTGALAPALIALGIVAGLIGTWLAYHRIFASGQA